MNAYEDVAGGSVWRRNSYILTAFQKCTRVRTRVQPGRPHCRLLDVQDADAQGNCLWIKLFQKSKFQKILQETKEAIDEKYQQIGDNCWHGLISLQGLQG